jgi:UDP-2,3-diacylglucosamine hydrolase
MKPVPEAPSGKAAIPAFPVPALLNAPPSWRCIDFISDLHLHDALPRTTEALANHLRHTPADAVLVLGDIFEVWVGDDMRNQPYEAACTAMFAAAGQRLYLGMMVGNRDFLLGDDMIRACHAHRLQDPTVLDAFGQRMLLIHGDELCLTDTPYLRFRSQVRNPAWQQAFLSAPLEARVQQARQMREASQAHQKDMPPKEWADVDEAAASGWMQAAGVKTLVHGHTHHPTDQLFGPEGGMRHVLSDWELDHHGHGHPRAEVLRLTMQGWERISLTGAKD